MNLAPLKNAFDARFPDAPDRQQRALDALLHAGFPDRHVERWKYTRSQPYADFALRALANERSATTGNAALEASLQNWHNTFKATYALIIIDGVLDEQRSRVPTGVSMKTHIADVMPFGEAPDDAIALLNDALPTTQISLSVAPGTKLDTPVHIVHVGGDAPTFSQIRIDVAAQTGSKIVITEHLLAAACDDQMHSCVVTARLAHSSTMHWHRLQHSAAKALIATRLDAILECDATLETLTLDVGGALVRNDLNVRLAARGATVHMRGVYLTAGKQHVDNHTHVDHAAENTTSTEDYRGVLRDHSRGVFNGKVYVHEGADGTDATQSNRNLLLSDHAEIDTKPELEIYADDVKCAHGATVGQLDDASLFYLRSRGIGERTATQLLTFAFCREIIKDIADATVRDAAERLIANEIPDFTALDLQQ